MPSKEALKNSILNRLARYEELKAEAEAKMNEIESAE